MTGYQKILKNTTAKDIGKIKYKDISAERIANIHNGYKHHQDLAPKYNSVCIYYGYGLNDALFDVYEPEQLACEIAGYLAGTDCGKIYYWDIACLIDLLMFDDMIEADHYTALYSCKTDGNEKPERREERKRILQAKELPLDDENYTKYMQALYDTYNYYRNDCESDRILPQDIELLKFLLSMCNIVVHSGTMDNYKRIVIGNAASDILNALIDCFGGCHFEYEMVLGSGYHISGGCSLAADMRTLESFIYDCEHTYDYWFNYEVDDEDGDN